MSACERGRAGVWTWLDVRCFWPELSCIPIPHPCASPPSLQTPRQFWNPPQAQMSLSSLCPWWGRNAWPKKSSKKSTFSTHVQWDLAARMQVEQ